MAEWSKPKTTETPWGVTTWEPKILAAPPALYGTFLDPALPAANVVRHTAARDAARLVTRPADGQLGPWLWACRIFFRKPYYGNTGANPRTGEVLPLNNGLRLPTQWYMASAYFVKDAHMDGSNSQWLMTAAHNVQTNVVTCDDTGLVTDMGTMMVAPADAVYVVAGWGPAAVGAWVDKISVMTEYYKDAYGRQTSRRFDGAALHVKDSTFPAALRELAPSLGRLPPPIAPATSLERNSIFVVPGFPGEINMFQDLAGLYIGGHHREGAGSQYQDFIAVRIVLNLADALQPGVLKWDNDICKVSAGVSGSACVMRIDQGLNQIPYIVGSVNTDGIGAPFAKRIDGQVMTAVDPVALLIAIGARKMNLVDLA